MSKIRIHEQIAFLRRQRGLTQEELAQAMGVTNQAVSKWESGQCCPDIQLLPEIAALFGVTTDQLLGRQPAVGLGDLCLRIKAYFSQLPPNASFESAYRIAALLHETTLSDGYRDELHWRGDHDYAVEDVRPWGMSVRTQTEGCTGRRGNCVFFSLGMAAPTPTPTEIRCLSASLDLLSDLHTLKVLFALNALTPREDDFASAEAIAAEAKLSTEDAEDVLSRLPVASRKEDGEMCYRLDGPSAHLPLLLSLLSCAGPL